MKITMKITTIIAMVTIIATSVVLNATECADNPECKYDYNSIADRIHKDRIHIPTPIDDLKERIKIKHPTQKMKNRIYGKNI